MTTLPPITVSQLDRNRLYALLERLDDESEQIEFLCRELGRATVVAPDMLPANVASLGSRLTFRNEDTGKEHVRILVMPRELEHYADGISILTAAGAAMLGLEIGASILWHHRGKPLNLTLLAVSRS